MTDLLETECFPFLCVGDSYDNAEEAWTEFYIDAERQFRWIRGHKFWRSPPRLNHRHRVEYDDEVFQVRARVVAVKKLPKDVPEASVRGPYPKEPDFCDTGIVVGYA